MRISNSIHGSTPRIPADPCICELERHHDSCYRTIIRIVPLRGNTPQRGGGVAYDASQQAGLFIEIERSDHTVSARALHDINIAAVNRVGKTDAPIRYGLLDSGRKRELGVQLFPF